MSLQRDIVDIYTKSSVYYLRLQYLVVCYLIVLAGAFFILPLPREMGINGNARLMVGGLLYIGFAVLLVYAPKLLYPLIGEFLSPYRDEKEVEEKFNQLSDKEKRELERELKREYGRTIKQNGVLIITMSKVKRIATNLFFQCLLIELFALTVLINSDHSLLISNPLTQHIADVLSNHVQEGHKDGKFFSIMIVETGGTGTTIPFSEYRYMVESVFFMYIISIISCIIRMICLFIFSRPILILKEVFPVIRNANNFKKFIWALLGTIIMAFVTIGFCFHIIQELSPYFTSILVLNSWIYYSILFNTVAILNVLFFFRFIEDWFKKAIGLI